MFRPRIIPVLLLKDNGLVKTVNFKSPNYIGDPINAVKLFNDMEADELIFLDIDASIKNRTISSELVKKIGNEAFMPFAVGGGINDIETVAHLLKSGSEKVIINTHFNENIELARTISNSFGRQSLVVSVDIKKNFFGKYKIFTHSGGKQLSHSLDDYIGLIESNGAGEIMINSIDRDGTMKGLDIKLLEYVSNLTTIPVIACGGTSSLVNIKNTYLSSNISAVAVGSLFVYHGPRKAVLINYPSKKILSDLFKNENL